MSPRQYTFHDGELRLYDGTSGTPFMFKVKFMNADPQIPVGRPRPDQILFLDRGRVSTDMIYHRGPDNVIFEPVQTTFSAWLTESINRTALEQALRCGTINADNWVTTKGSTQIEGATLQAFAGDTSMKTVNVELIYYGQTDNVGKKMTEVAFPPQNIQFGAATPDGILITCQGLIYGDITDITGFTSPYNESTQP